MSDLLTRLRDRSWRITSQRRAVAEVLAGAQSHFTAEEVHERAREVLPEVSLATVYNTLRELVAMGEVLEINTRGASRYDSNVGRAHHHLSCIGCGELLDVYPSGLDNVRLEDVDGYELQATSITFEGRCRRCAQPA